MASAEADSSFLSTESTISCLLASSGHLKSSLLPPDHCSSIRYRNKDYESASAALDAYIADFERSLQDGVTSTGRLVIPNRHTVTLRNTDVLREQLTDRELDFLTLPVSSLRHRGHRDRLSMTTEELLAIPCDGSMPVTRTSAFLQGLLCQSGHDLMGQSELNHTLGHHTQPWFSPEPRHRASDGGRKNHTAPDLYHPVPQRRRNHRTLSHRATKPSNPETTDSETLSHLHYPCWLNSLQDQRCPAWVLDCDETAGAAEPWQNTDLSLPRPRAPPDHRPRAPSWLEDLEDDQPHHRETMNPGHEETEDQITLRNLRLQLAECHTHTDTMDTVFREDKIESLIQKVQKVQNSLSLRGEEPGCEENQSPGCTGTHGRDPITPCPREETVCLKDSPAASPGNTEDLLDAHRSWDSPPVTVLSPVPLGGAADLELTTESLTERGVKALGSFVRKPPGPVEALKQLLFSLQAMEVEQQKQQQLTAPTHTDKQQMDHTPERQMAETEAEFEDFECVHGRQSLQRALHHLGRLKNLVDEHKGKEREREEEEEREEDEGLYSC
ncbi:lung adenoma susceptibility protein 2 [Polymixia lowei]